MSRYRTALKHGLILAGVLLALALPLMFLLEDFIRDAIVLPLAYLAWLVGTVLGALPEGCLLLPVVGLGAFLAVRSLQRRQESAPSAKAPPRVSIGIARVWLERIEHVAAGSYSRERLEHYVGQFVTSVIGYENRMSPREALRATESGEIRIPDNVRRYVYAAFQSGVAPKQKWPTRIWNAVLRVIRGRRATAMPLDEIVTRVDPALTFVEQELRIAHGEAGSEQRP